MKTEDDTGSSLAGKERERGGGGRGEVTQKND